MPARRLRTIVAGMTICIIAARSAAAATVLACALAAPASASPTVVHHLCPPEAERAVCGHVDVPLDRSDPGAGTIAIAFEQYSHTGPGPAVSAIIPNFGGAGRLHDRAAPDRPRELRVAARQA